MWRASAGHAGREGFTAPLGRDGGCDDCGPRDQRDGFGDELHSGIRDGRSHGAARTTADLRGLAR